MFNLFGHDIISEMKGILLYIISPLAVASIVIIVYLRLAQKERDRKPQISLGPLSLLMAMLVTPVYLFIIMRFKSFYSGNFSVEHVVAGVVMALFLSIPIICLVVPAFLLLLWSSARGRWLPSDGILYAFGALCVVVEYLWLAYVLSF